MSSIGSVEGVLRILGRSSEEVNTVEVSKFLDEAELKIKARHNKDFMKDEFIVKNTRSLTYNLYFPAKENTVPKVYVKGLLKTEDVDYTYSDSVITFISGKINLYDKVVVYYIPEYFDDYANYLASERMYSVSLLDTENAVSKAIYDTIKENVKIYEGMTFEPNLSTFVDHKEFINDVY